MCESCRAARHFLAQSRFPPLPGARSLLRPTQLPTPASTGPTFSCSLWMSLHPQPVSRLNLRPCSAIPGSHHNTGSRHRLGTICAFHLLPSPLPGFICSGPLRALAPLSSRCPLSPLPPFLCNFPVWTTFPFEPLKKDPNYLLHLVLQIIFLPSTSVPTPPKPSTLPIPISQLSHLSPVPVFLTFHFLIMV